MKIFFTILLAIISLLSLKAQEIVYFIPGWYSQWVIYSSHTRIMEEIFPGSQVEICKWSSNRLWKNAKIHAGKFVEEFSEELLKNPEPEKITLIGHSLGGRIVLDLASVLAENGKKVDRLILLGTAGKMDEKDIANCRKVSGRPVINIFCPDDNMLKLYLYKEKHPPLGFSGLPGKLSHFQQYRMPVDEKDLKIGKLTIIKAGSTEFYRETAAHLAKKYLQTLADALNGRISETP